MRPIFDLSLLSLLHSDPEKLADSDALDGRALKRRGETLRMLRSCAEQLDSRGEAPAAKAWRGILADSAFLSLIATNIRFFELAIERRQHKLYPKPNDVRRLADHVRRIDAEMNAIRRQAISLYEDFWSTPGFPERREIGPALLNGIYAVHDVASAIERMADAIRAAHGENPSGRTPLALKLDGDPFEHFAVFLSRIWTMTGRNMSKADRTAFEAILRVLHEAVTGEEDMPEKIVTRVIARRASEETSG